MENTHMINLTNYGFNSVSDKGKTQATLHSRFAQVGEYPFSSLSLHFLTRISYGNSTKLNIPRLRPNFEIGSTRGETQ